MDSDRRKHPRADFRESVQYRVSSNEAAKGCMAYDISEGGLRFTSFDFIPMNTILNLHMDLTPERSIDLHGKVIWIQQVPHSSRYYIGLEFDESQALESSRPVIRKYTGS